MTLFVVIFKIILVAQIYDFILVLPLLNSTQCKFGLAKILNTFLFIILVNYRFY
jgi:hypothetical protein